MYKCSSCGKRYKDKPDFCECGSDSFKKIISKSTVIAQQQAAQEAEQAQENNEEFPVTKIILAIIISIVIIAVLIIFFLIKGNQKQTSEPEPNHDINIVYLESEQKSNTSMMDSAEAQKKKENKDIEVKKQEQQPLEVQNIQPQKPESVINEQVKPEPIKVEAPKTEIQKVEQKKPEPEKKAVTTPTQNTTTKTAVQPAKKASDRTTATTSKNTQTQKKTTSTSKARTQTTKTVQTVKPQQPVKTTVNNVKQLDRVPKLMTPQEIELRKRELTNYKQALKNQIISNISSTNAIGDGECSITFKVAKNGEITNRHFSQMSQNGKLNDKVYAGMIKTPSYNPPPSSYKNETLKLTVKKQSGNVEVTLQ